jgi:hypothetical protein
VSTRVDISSGTPFVNQQESRKPSHVPGMAAGLLAMRRNQPSRDELISMLTETEEAIGEEEHEEADPIEHAVETFSALAPSQMREVLARIRKNLDA